MIDSPVIFYSTAFLIVIFTLLSLFSKAAIYSIIAAMFTFFAGSIFFYLLGSEYNAIIQAAVYGLAIPVILGLSVMFIKQEKNTSGKNFMITYLTILFSGIFVLAIIYLNLMSTIIEPDAFNIINYDKIGFSEVMSGFKKGLFLNYIWSFELLSLLLTITIAGFTMFKKEKY